MSIKILANGFDVIPEEAKVCPQCGYTKAIGASQIEYPVDAFNPPPIKAPLRYWRFTCTNCQCVWMWDERDDGWCEETPTKEGIYLFWQAGRHGPSIHDTSLGANDGDLRINEGSLSYSAAEWPWKGLWKEVKYEPPARPINMEVVKCSKREK